MASFDIEFPENLESAEAVQWIANHNPYPVGTEDHQIFADRFWEGQPSFTETKQDKWSKVTEVASYLVLAGLAAFIVIESAIAFIELMTGQ